MGTIIFKSQIATTIEQSKRLLELGLKPETADMVLFKSYDLPQYPFDYTFNQDPNALINCSYVPMVKGNQPYIQDGNIPAWSYDRLREIIINHYIAYSTNLKTTDYESLINEIEELIKHNELKKDYIKVWVNT